MGYLSLSQYPTHLPSMSILLVFKLIYTEQKNDFKTRKNSWLKKKKIKIETDMKEKLIKISKIKDVY